MGRLRERDGRQPVWSLWQKVAAFVLLLASLALFLIDGLDVVLFGRDITFGILPWALLVVAVYVIFGLNLPSLLGKD